MFECLYVK